jgi:hypothetical protein
MRRTRQSHAASVESVGIRELRQLNLHNINSTKLTQGGDLMIICKKCLKGDEVYKEAEFDYWQWFDATEDFDDSHGRYCDICGKEFEDGETVVLVNE